MSDYGKQIFHGLCPYTGESCETFECGTCEVEADERLWLKELDDELKNGLPVEPCVDCVSRQAAIEALSHMMDTDGFRDGWAVSRANVDCMLRSLPSVEPERKTGKWLPHMIKGYGESIDRDVCSECRFCFYGYPTWSWKYCPMCGAPMEVETDHS